MPALDDQGIELARDAVEVLLPGRSATAWWACVDGDRAVVAFAFDDQERPDLEITLRRGAGRRWKQVGAGQAGDWAPLEPPVGVATSFVELPAGTVAARVRADDGAESEVEPTLGLAMVACWDIAYAAEWRFPTVVAVRDRAGAWRPATSA